MVTTLFRDKDVVKKLNVPQRTLESVTRSVCHSLPSEASQCPKTHVPMTHMSSLTKVMQFETQILTYEGEDGHFPAKKQLSGLGL